VREREREREKRKREREEREEREEKRPTRMEAVTVHLVDSIISVDLWWKSTRETDQ